MNHLCYRDDTTQSFGSCTCPGAGVVLDRGHEGGAGGSDLVEDDRIAVAPNGPYRQGGNGGESSSFILGRHGKG